MQEIHQLVDDLSHNIQCEVPKIAKLAYNSNNYNYGLWYL